MSWDVFKRSVAIALENRIPALNFFGGEPLLNPEFFSMLQTSLKSGFTLIIATNCRPLSKKRFYTRFLDITKDYKKRIVVVTARDEFHLCFYDPAEIIERLRSESYEVVVNDYSNHTVLLSEFNANKPELQKLNSRFSCCENKWTDHIGVLPNGGWTICPPSLESFGDIFSNSLEEVVEYKRRLPLGYKEGCSECLKDFKGFRAKFEKTTSDRHNPL
jgi:MoaA/NifB/PqqE/SkfB family radical SAM enzyme